MFGRLIAFAVVIGRFVSSRLLGLSFRLGVLFMVVLCSRLVIRRILWIRLSRSGLRRRISLMVLMFVSLVFLLFIRVWLRLMCRVNCRVGRL